MPRYYAVKKLGPKLMLHQQQQQQQKQQQQQQQQQQQHLLLIQQQQHQAAMDELDDDECCSSRSGTESPPPFTDPTSVKLYKPLESVTMSKHKGKKKVAVFVLFVFLKIIDIEIAPVVVVRTRHPLLDPRICFRNILSVFKVVPVGNKKKSFLHPPL